MNNNNHHENSTKRKSDSMNFDNKRRETGKSSTYADKSRDTIKEGRDYSYIKPFDLSKNKNSQGYGGR